MHSTPLDPQRIRRAHARLALLPALLGLLATLAPGCGRGGHPEILVVVNAESPVSLAIGRYYADARRIPEENVVELPIPLQDPTLRLAEQETISREDYDTLIREPLERHLSESGLTESIRILVTTKGIPLRISGPGARMTTWLSDVTRAAVDAELSLLFSEADGTAGVVDSVNPYFDSALGFGTFRKKHPDASLRYMVARLTGYAAQLDPETGVPLDIKRLIDAATAEISEPTKKTTWLVDEDPSLDAKLAAGNISLLRPTAAVLDAMQLEVQSNRDAEFVHDVHAIQGYASWGSNDGHDPGPPFYGEIEGPGEIESKRYPGTFAPRALAVDFVSTNARTFTAPAEYGQSLVADLVRAGVAGAAGHVFEPSLSGVSRPYILLRRYAEGVPAIEAYYRSIPYLGWMNVYVGDPLMTVPNPLDPANPDRDGDGVPDTADNCSDLPNPEQRDTNGDGFGNLCDADVDGDGLITTSWGAVFPLSERGDVEWIALTARNGPYDPNYDLDGDGDVDAGDVSIANLNLFLQPGPSGQARRKSP
jgi:uncharacterized protein (TIGR03790 family)